MTWGRRVFVAVLLLVGAAAWADTYISDTWRKVVNDLILDGVGLRIEEGTGINYKKFVAPGGGFTADTTCTLEDDANFIPDSCVGDGVDGGGGGGGAPTTVDYLVGTADATLSAEIVVGTTPGGELGGTWGSPTIDDTLTVDGWTLTNVAGLTCTDCVALGGESTGNYMTNVTGDAEIVVTHTPAEGSTATLAIASSLARDAEVALAYQPLDADLTAIAALVTTAFGRGLLDDADAAAVRATISAQAASTELDNLINNCVISNTATPIPDSCVGNGVDDTGGAGSSNSVETTISLSGGSGYFSATVNSQTWVATTSEIVCTPFGTTADSLTPEAISVADITVTASDRVAGTSFNINVYNPNGLEGTLRVHCIGV